MYYINILHIISSVSLEINVRACSYAFAETFSAYFTDATQTNDIRSCSTRTRPIIIANTGRRRHKLGTGGLRSQSTVIGLSLDQAMLMNLACHYLNCS